MLKEKRKNIGDKLTKSIPNMVVYLGLAVMIFDDSIHAFFDVDRFIIVEIRISILVAVISSLIWSISHYSLNVNSSMKKIVRWQNSKADIIDLWGEIDIATLYNTSNIIKILNLAGTQFAKLGSQDSLDAIFQMNAKKKVKLLVGDPYGEGVKLRYKSGWGEPQTYETGLEGIERRLKDMFIRWKKTSKKFRDHIEIRVFSIYPTVSLVNFDNNYYSATYGFELRGGDCPKVHTTQGSSYSNFLDKHFDNVFSQAITLEEWVKKYHQELL